MGAVDVIPIECEPHDGRAVIAWLTILTSMFSTVLDA